MRPINVSLDATTWEIAKKMPNFSSWVRSKLREEDANHNHRLDDERFQDRKRIQVVNELIGYAQSCKMRRGYYPNWYNSRAGSPSDWIVDQEMNDGLYLQSIKLEEE